MTCKPANRFMKAVTGVLFALLLSLSASTVSAAESQPGAAARVNHVVVGSRNFTNAKKLRRYLIRIIGSKAKKIKAVSSCSCAAVPEEWEAWGGCFKGCLTSWGISYGSATTCGGICAIAFTGNPVGIAVCAGCLGTAEWIVAGCAMSCAWARGGNTWLEQVRDGRPNRRAPREARANFKSYSGS